jgi:predicted alpha/beta-fold hydrolase
MPEFVAEPFRPRRFFSNGHVQTLLGNYLPRRSSLPEPTAELVEVSGGVSYQMPSRILCHCHWQPEPIRSTRPAIILVHGLEGSSSSQYVLGNAAKLWRAGANIVRMNMRNCGGTERLTPTLYHSGLSTDVEAVMTHCLTRYSLQSIALAGYSMGGNLVLKLAGDLGPAAPPQLKAVVGVSPAVDLAASADALHEPLNRLYERHFLKALARRFRRKASLFPRVYDPNRTVGIDSLRQWDDRITALYCGFTGAADYYARAAAARVIDRIAVPTLILHANDDPFVRLIPSTREKILANPHITFLDEAHGGHCAFLSSPDPQKKDDGYWAETTLLRFILAHP